MCSDKLNKAVEPQEVIGGRGDRKKKETYLLNGKIKLDLGSI